MIIFMLYPVVPGLFWDIILLLLLGIPNSVLLMIFRNRR
ncbi:hypothetical protein LINGRAHAP2_LOCUS28924 [Linum grandiflorum]